MAKKRVVKKLTPAKIFLGLLGLGVVYFVFLAAPLVNFVFQDFLYSHSTLRNSQKENFVRTHKDLSQKIIPTDFQLVETTETPLSLDVRMSLRQKYKITSTRKQVVEQLTPRFKAYGITTRELHKAEYNPSNGDDGYINPETESADNYEYSWKLQLSKPNSNSDMKYLRYGVIGVEITFFPGDWEEVAEYKAYRVKDKLPTTTEYITVEWICQDKITLCSEITYGSK